jgi:hypothetical protein
LIGCPGWNVEELDRQLASSHSRFVNQGANWQVTLFADVVALLVLLYRLVLT